VKGWTNKGYVYYKLGYINDAIKSYDTALRIDPYNSDAIIGRSEVIKVLWPHYYG